MVKAIANQILNEKIYGKAQASNKRQRLYRVLDKKIGRLRAMQRSCVVHYYGLRGHNSISQPKIARMFKVSQNTVWYHLTQARKLLKTKLSK